MKEKLSLDEIIEVSNGIKATIDYNIRHKIEYSPRILLDHDCVEDREAGGVGKQHPGKE